MPYSAYFFNELRRYASIRVLFLIGLLLSALLGQRGSAYFRNCILSRSMSYSKKSEAHHSNLKSFLAGGFGGLCAVTAGHPFDTIKVRLQTMPRVKPGETPMYRGAVDCAVKTIKKEGVRGLYKGMLVPLFGATPLFALCFFGFSLGKELLAQDAKNIKKSEIFFAGMLSGVFTTVVMAPGERIKCLLQVPNLGFRPKYTGPVDVIKHLYLEGGVRNLFKGTGATLLRDVPASGVFFVSYDWIRELTSTTSKSDPGVAQTLFAGGMAGVFNWLIAIPPDVLKSRLQIAPEGKYPCGLRSVFEELLTKEGVLALYRGAAPVLIRAFPANAAFTNEVQPDDWNLYLGRALLAYRASAHTSTGVSPVKMLTGREMRVPSDILLPRKKPTGDNAPQNPSEILPPLEQEILPDNQSPAAHELSRSEREDRYSASNTDVDVAKLLVWLEDRVICSLPISDRFRDIDSKTWPNYVDMVNCGDYKGNRGSKSYATSQEADIFAGIDGRLWGFVLTAQADSSQFREGVHRLAEALNVPQHPDPKQTFRGICVLIERMMSKESLKRAREEHREKIELLRVDDIFLGFEVDDPALLPAAVALRLLHVSELRNLQDLINFAIVKVQQLTADPKTDEKLGQVGF
ncbi:unnamed protein product [Hydatigera taeniaeformis]|uniref:Uncharacterized protein n=1 Tax=Hydatigena taeniaeformis TaxID=6205 RepID=A0A3P7FWC4_HYDTA|nr:unnamed protein product [Hydatigera taeniaeformis]